MLAARLHQFGSIDDLRLETIPDPVPGAGEVVVRIAAAGLNRADTEFIKGVYGGAPRTDAATWRDRFFPHIPGLEPVGRVEAIGAGVRQFRTGDRVLIHSHFACGKCEFCLSGRDNFCTEMKVLGTQTPGLGAFAERIKVPEDRLLPLPDSLSFTAAATVGVQAATVWWMMKYRADIKPGDVVLVQGAAGGIGTAALQVARLLGAQPVAVTRSRDKVDAMMRAGAEHAIVDDGTTGIAESLRAFAPDGAAVVIEAVGAPVWEESLKSVKQGGTLLICGAHAGAVVPLNLGLVFSKQISIVGSARAPKFAVLEAIELVADGKIDIPIDRIYPFGDIHAALHRLEEGRHVGKIVVDMEGGNGQHAIA